MSNEKFMKHYVEVANAAIADATLRNINLQANAQFVDELIGEVTAENTSLRTQVQEMGEQIIRLCTERDNNREEFLKNKEEIESVRHHLTHIDTFRNQLIETQKVVERQAEEIYQLEHPKAQIKTEPNNKTTKKYVKPARKVAINTTDSTDTDAGTF